MTREIKLTNSLTGKKERLAPLQPGKLSFYSCGPTVYGLVHIGNLRAGLVSDLAFRVFERAGYEVTYVRNYTDVDDKIIQRAREEGMTPEALARKYTVEVEKDFAVAGLREPTHKTTVTTHIPEIIAMIGKIIANGKAYAVDGDVYFSVAAFPSYGKLSKKPLEDLVAGARVEVDARKRSPADFALWKAAKPGEPFWESPWGRGRPGWHIECSAMSSRWLGERIDVHHGGEDLIFPHHENEIAQSEAASGVGPFVGCWIHHAFLNFSSQKMSKSLGNIVSARDFLTQFSGEIARYMILSVHYRVPIDYSDAAVEQTLTALERIYEAKAKALGLATPPRTVADLQAEGIWGQFLADCEKTSRDIDAHYFNDLNTSGALGALFALIREFNRVCENPRAVATPSVALGAQELLRILEKDIGSVLGVGLLTPEQAREQISRVRAARLAAAANASAGSSAGSGGDGGVAGGLPDEAEIQKEIAARIEARRSKDFARADAIRKGLLDRGVELKDAPDGKTTWRYR